MRFFPVLFLFCLMFSSCEDGEIEVQSFDFSDAAIRECGEDSEFFLYKINGKEAIILKIAESELKNENSSEVFNIDGSAIQLIYRLYSDDISAGFLCQAIPPSTPAVSEEWIATGGTFTITNAANLTEVDPETGAILPDGYNHTITFNDVTFDTGNGTVTYDNDDLAFGSYKTDESNAASFICDEDDDCAVDTCGTKLFRTEGLQALTLNLSQTNHDYLFSNTVGVKSVLIDATNKMTYQVFEEGVTEDYICPAIQPVTPIKFEEWVAENGVDGVSGIVEVNTAQIAGNVRTHTVSLKKVSFNRGTSAFTFGTTYVFGRFTTNNP